MLRTCLKICYIWDMCTCGQGAQNGPNKYLGCNFAERNKPMSLKVHIFFIILYLLLLFFCIIHFHYLLLFLLFLLLFIIIFLLLILFFLFF